MTRNGKRGVWLVSVIVIVTTGSVAHPFGRVKAARQTAGGLLSEVPAPDAVRQTLTNKCVDCHSTGSGQLQTHWPAYSYIFPVSWLVERDVAEGRQHLDFSAWHTYSQEQKLDLLNRIASEAKSGTMPPGQYSFVHRKSLLTTDEQHEIYTWAKAARKNLREEAVK